MTTQHGPSAAQVSHESVPEHIARDEIVTGSVVFDVSNLPRSNSGVPLTAEQFEVAAANLVGAFGSVVVEAVKKEPGTILPYDPETEGSLGVVDRAELIDFVNQDNPTKDNRTNKKTATSIFKKACRVSAHLVLREAVWSDTRTEAIRDEYAVIQAGWDQIAETNDQDALDAKFRYSEDVAVLNGRVGLIEERYGAPRRHAHENIWGMRRLPSLELVKPREDQRPFVYNKQKDGAEPTKPLNSDGIKGIFGEKTDKFYGGIEIDMDAYLAAARRGMDKTGLISEEFRLGDKTDQVLVRFINHKIQAARAVAQTSS